MEKQIKEKYNEHILDEVLRRYGILQEDIKELDGFESFIYEFNRQDEDFILRIGHSSRRSYGLIQGEVDFINYLAAGGVGAAKAVLSENSELVEAIDDQQGGHFLATAFVKAQGGHVGREAWGPAMWVEYGRQIGLMHRLSKSYQLPDPAWRRPEWDDPANCLDMAAWLDGKELEVVEKFDTLKARLDALPRGKNDYGLIHQDAHRGNFYIDKNGKLTFFDFDDCCYGWYAYDLAMVLFYAVPWDERAPDFAREFLKYFLQGYRQENQIGENWMAQLPDFLKLREIDLYAIIKRDMSQAEIEADPWCAGYMAGRKARIEADVPFLDLDFRMLKFDFNS